MKRFLIYITIIIAIVLMTSCVSNDVDGNNIETTENEMRDDNLNEEPTEVKTEEGGVINEFNTTEFNDVFLKNHYFQSELYSIAPSELSIKDLDRPGNNTEWIKSLNITYPQLYGLKDGEKQHRINNLLYSKTLSYQNILENRDYIEYINDYKIMYSDDDFLSVLFIGEVSDSRTANRFAFAMTINLEDGKEVNLESFFEVNESFITNYLFSKFNVVENNFKDIQENVSFIEKYVEAYSSNVHINDFYIKEDGLGIIIPTYNSMGYILIEGKIEY